MDLVWTLLAGLHSNISSYSGDGCKVRLTCDFETTSRALKSERAANKCRVKQVTLSVGATSFLQSQYDLCVLREHFLGVYVQTVGSGKNSLSQRVAGSAEEMYRKTQPKKKEKEKEKAFVAATFPALTSLAVCQRLVKRSTPSSNVKQKNSNQIQTALNLSSGAATLKCHGRGNETFRHRRSDETKGPNPAPLSCSALSSHLLPVLILSSCCAFAFLKDHLQQQFGFFSLFVWYRVLPVFRLQSISQLHIEKSKSPEGLVHKKLPYEPLASECERPIKQSNFLIIGSTSCNDTNGSNEGILTENTISPTSNMKQHEATRSNAKQHEATRSNAKQRSYSSGNTLIKQLKELNDMAKLKAVLKEQPFSKQHQNSARSLLLLRQTDIYIRINWMVISETKVSGKRRVGFGDKEFRTPTGDAALFCVFSCVFWSPRWLLIEKYSETGVGAWSCSGRSPRWEEKTCASSLQTNAGLRCSVISCSVVSCLHRHRAAETNRHSSELTTISTDV
ncbi:uncharacterized protein V6R79_024856 [Siganus canaliculatus]